MNLFFLSQLWLCIAALCMTGTFGDEIIYCKKDLIEPSIADVLALSVPAELSHHLVNTLETIRKVPYSSLVLDFKLPIISLISQGKFTVVYNSIPGMYYTFNDISLLRRMGYLKQTACGLLSGILPLKSFCECNSPQLSKPTSESAIDNYVISQDLSDYCVEKSFCTDRSMTHGSCFINVDPFSSNCVMIKLHEAATADSENLDRNNSIVLYTSQIPTMYDTLGGLIPVLKETPRVSNSWKDVLNSSDELLVLQFILQRLPVYLLNFGLGMVLVLNATEFSEHWFGQLVMQTIYGVLFAFIVLIAILYRSSKSVMDRYRTGIIADIAMIPFGFSLVSIVLANSFLLRGLLDLLINFWMTGAPFGVWWLGKAYFVSCVCITFLLSKYFSLWEPDSTSWQLMRYSFKGLGLLLLSQSTASSLVSLLLVALGIFHENISYITRFSYMVVKANMTTPTYKYMGRKLNMDEVKQISQDHTKKALDELRQHLNENSSSALYSTVDILRESGKKDEASLIARFAEGAYPGVPYTAESCTRSSYLDRISLSKALLYAGSAGVVVLAIVAFYKQ